MSDLISRQVAINIVDEVEDKWMRGEIDLKYAPIIKAIQSIPHTDTVEVVRCMNCIYGEERFGNYICRKLDEDWEIRFPPTHFCSYGEMREPYTE